MFKDIRRITVYVLVCIPLFVITFLVTKQIQYAFEVKKAFATRDLDVDFSFLQQLAALNESSTKTFFLAFVCLLMILCGIIIILKATDDALSFTKERKVRYSLKTVYPGSAVAIAGCLLLTYAVYHSAQESVKNGISLGEHQSLSQGAKTAGLTQSGSIRGMTTGPKHQDELAKSKWKNADSNTFQNKIDEVSVGEVQKDGLADDHAKQVSEKEVRWAVELANRSIIHGNLPTKAERNRYLGIVNHLGGPTNSVHWAFQLLLRTDKGYQPSQAELEKYEMVVMQQLKRS